MPATDKTAKKELVNIFQNGVSSVSGFWVVEGIGGSAVDVVVSVVVSVVDDVVVDVVVMLGNKSQVNLRQVAEYLKLKGKNNPFISRVFI